MDFMKSIIWLVTSAVCAVVATVLVMATVGGDFAVLIIAGFLGGISGVYLFEFADVEVSLGNEYLDQAVVAMVGAIAFALIASLIGGDAIGFE
ncbi:hypothetical protein PsW64_02906 [Pseudovibrio sp. W64]|nr:hypothetical protein PsW64_02906 [Pseudovibrio sp. W64]KZK82572.1 hypothetical protein PsAD46_03702 [Pseudovibrio sp. Ad46]KZK83258.1 hypothetical protein PsAD13_03464 [Pseudovibrio sp. Ad13]KZK98568.1 hypothetical protein PsW74_03157 [Pseudovibrio sp. W74]KZL01827.1 hypothetical protein PsAD5_00397 [Pseudovibrio sp. Ad5]KZL08414.1 hypothetical protein PsAD14_03564 [Pseudovibrio sp. Ad14]KZL19200.1 hypothetical protein PsWM33_04797 [Pseudovibrio sp. WM33]KZL22945.1 hypothetical protein Ps